MGRLVRLCRASPACLLQASAHWPLKRRRWRCLACGQRWQLMFGGLSLSWIAGQVKPTECQHLVW